MKLCDLLRLIDSNEGKFYVFREQCSSRSSRPIGGVAIKVAVTGATSICGPIGSLAMDATGALYGTQYAAGAYGYGCVFKLTPSNGGWI